MVKNCSCLLSKLLNESPQIVKTSMIEIPYSGLGSYANARQIMLLSRQKRLSFRLAEIIWITVILHARSFRIGRRRECYDVGNGRYECVDVWENLMVCHSTHAQIFQHAVVYISRQNVH